MRSESFLRFLDDFFGKILREKILVIWDLLCLATRRIFQRNFVYTYVKLPQKHEYHILFSAIMKIMKNSAGGQTKYVRYLWIVFFLEV